MSRPIYTNLTALDPNDYAVIDKDTGTVLGTNLALVRWSDVPEDVRDGITSNDSAAFDYADEHGIPLYTVNRWEAIRLRAHEMRWKAVSNHPLMRRADLLRPETSALARVLAELDRLSKIEQEQ